MAIPTTRYDHSHSPQSLLWTLIFVVFGVPVLLVYMLPTVVVTVILSKCSEPLATLYAKMWIKILGFGASWEAGTLENWKSWFRPAKATADLPKQLRGTYWMDGNPAPDDVVNLSACYHNTATRTLHQAVYGSKCWTWHDTFTGWISFLVVMQLRITYRFTFDEQYENAQIHMWLFDLFPVPMGTFGQAFTMHLTEGNVWDRRTWNKKTPTECHHYYLRPLMETDEVTGSAANTAHMLRDATDPKVASTVMPGFVRV